MQGTIVRHGGRTPAGGRRLDVGAPRSWRAAQHARDGAGGGWVAGAISAYSEAVFFSWPCLMALRSPAGGLGAGPGVQGWTVSQLPSGNGRYFIYRPSPWQQPSDPHPTARPPRRGRDPAALPRRTPASPQALGARASGRSSFDLAGKISPCLLVWQIAVQNASDAMRGSEPEMSFAANNRESISH